MNADLFRSSAWNTGRSPTPLPALAKPTTGTTSTIGTSGTIATTTRGAPTNPHPVSGFAATLQSVAENSGRSGAAGSATGTGTTPPANEAKIRKSAKDFEAMVASQLLSPMWEGVEVDKTFGGGHGEEMFRGMLLEQYGKIVAERGGLGLANTVYHHMLKTQEKLP